ncbi:hypothetical protein GCM10023213_23460 [Prosthecobacter algae]|uniref:Novel STAND NTPase 1 domain-containing protein n=2 Tax=Prosthecobacter algae TaxID=1144682 RepID=A0ABP9P4B9_9BACT
MKEGRGLLDVLPPKPDAIARLIEEPARLAGLTFENKDGQSLSSRILRDASHSPELLPLVEFVLLELFNQADENKLTHTAYDELGGVDGALRRKAESTYNNLPSAAAETLGKVLQALVTLGDESDRAGESDKPVRLRATLATFPENSPARQLIDAFIAARLFTTAQFDGSNEATFTVAHESLLRVWPKAVAWKDQNSDFLRARARITVRMREGGLLLDGDPLLPLSKSYLLTREEGFSSSQTAWIKQSIKTAETKTAQAIKRRRLAFTALSLLTLFAAAAAIWALQSANEAVKQKNQATENARQASRNLDSAIRIADKTMESTSAKLTYRSGMQSLRKDLLNEVAVLTYELANQATENSKAQFGFYRAEMERLLAEYDYNPSLKNLFMIRKNYSHLLLLSDENPEEYEIQIYTLNTGYKSYRAALAHENKELQKEFIAANKGRLVRCMEKQKDTAVIGPVVANYNNAFAALETDPEKAQAFYLEAIKAVDDSNPNIFTDGETLRAFVAPRVNLIRSLLQVGKVKDLVTGVPNKFQATVKSIVENTVKTVNEAVIVSPDYPEVNEAASHALSCISDFYLAALQPENGLLLAEESLRISTQLVARNPGIGKYVSLLAYSHKALSQILHNPRDPRFISQLHIFHAVESANYYLISARMRRDNIRSWNSAIFGYQKVVTLMAEIDSPELDEYYKLSLDVISEAENAVRFNVYDWCDMLSIYSSYASHLQNSDRSSDAYAVAKIGLDKALLRGQEPEWSGSDWFQISLVEIVQALGNAAESQEILPEIIPQVEAALRLLVKPENRMRAAEVASIKRLYTKSLFADGQLDTALAEAENIELFLKQWTGVRPHYFLRIQENNLKRVQASFYEAKGNSDLEKKYLYDYIEGFIKLYGQKKPDKLDQFGIVSELEELRKLAGEVEANKHTFTVIIPCQGHNGTRRFSFRFKNYPADEKPLSDQLSAFEELGWHLPISTLENFQKIQEIAFKENIDFVDLLKNSATELLGLYTYKDLQKVGNAIGNLHSSDDTRVSGLVFEYRKHVAENTEQISKRIERLKALSQSLNGIEKANAILLMANLSVDIATLTRATSKDEAIRHLGYAYAYSIEFRNISDNEGIYNRLNERIGQARTFILKSNDEAGSFAASMEKFKLRPPTQMELLKYGDEEVVIFLSGRNSNNQKIYNYLLIKFKNYFSMRAAIKESFKNLDVTKYGEVIAAGKGDPSDETQRDIEKRFKVLSFPGAKTAPDVNDSTALESSSVPKLPDWFITGIKAGKNESQLTEYIRAELQDDVFVRGYDKALWTPDFILRIAKVYYIGYLKQCMELKSTDEKRLPVNQ